MREVAADCFHAFRSLRRGLPSTLLAVAVLGLASSIHVAAVSLVSATAWRPLAVPDPGALRYVQTAGTRGPQGLTYPEFVQQAAAAVFPVFCARARDSAYIGPVDRRARFTGEWVSANYFDVLGITPRLGRTFRAGLDDQLSEEPTIVLHETLRQRLFGSGDGVGDRILIDGRLHLVIGVVGPDFRGMLEAWESTQYWVVVEHRAGHYERQWRDYLATTPAFLGIGRIDGGISRAEIRDRLTASWQMSKGASTGARVPRYLVSDRLSVRLPYESTALGPGNLSGAAILVSGLLLLVALINVAGMLNARVIGRANEIAVRLALGAPSSRVRRHLGAECLMLTASGGILGLLLSRFLLSLFLWKAPRELGAGGNVRLVSLDVPLDFRVLGYAVLLCLLTGWALGIWLSRQASRANLRDVLAEGTQSGARTATNRLRRWVVVPQIALSLTLLLLATSVVRPLVRAELEDDGYDPRSAAFVQFELPLPDVHRRTASVMQSFVRRRTALELRIARTAGAVAESSSVALASALPFENSRAWTTGQTDNGQSEHRFSHYAAVSPGYFETLGIPLLVGRDFVTADLAADTGSASPLVAIITMDVATVVWPGQSAVGKRVAIHEPGSRAAPAWMEIVGVVGDIKGPHTQSLPTVYVPMRPPRHARAVIVRAHGSAERMAEKLKQVVLEADGDVRIERAATVADMVDDIRFESRLAAATITTAAILAAVLAFAGLYGLVTYWFAQRTREIGIRLALGATVTKLVRLALWDASVLIGLGCLAGGILSFAAARLFSNVAAPVTLDPTAFIAGLVALALLVLGACLLPALRASRLPLSVALRNP